MGFSTSHRTRLPEDSETLWGREAPSPSFRGASASEQETQRWVGEERAGVLIAAPAPRLQAFVFDLGSLTVKPELTSCQLV